MYSWMLFHLLEAIYADMGTWTSNTASNITTNALFDLVL